MFLLRALIPSLLAAGGAVTAFAQTPPAPPPAQKTVVEMGADKVDEAIKALEPLKKDPKAPPQQLAMLGVLYLETGRAKEALEVLGPLAKPETADPAVLYNAGRAALALDDVPRGEVYLMRSMLKSPSSPARRELGLLRGRQSRAEEAYGLLRPWCANHPNDLEARRAAAVLALQFERTAEAEQLLSDLPQDRPGIRLLWVELLLQKAQGPAALEMLAPLLQKHPSAMAADVARLAADAYLRNGRAADAVTALEGKVNNDPRSALLLGRAHFQAGNPEKALATVGPFASSITSLPADKAPSGSVAAGLLLEYGRLLITGGKAEAALPALERLIRISPEEKQAWQLLGQALAAAGKRPEAEKALAEFQRLSKVELTEEQLEAQRRQDQADPSLRNLRAASALFARGEAEEALRLVRNEMLIAPEDTRARTLEVRFLLGMKRTQEAMAAAQRSLVFAPNAADSHYQRGLVRLVQQDRTGAEQDLRKALELDPNHVAAMSDLGVLMMAIRRNTEAKSLFERVLSLVPDDPVAKQNLAKLKTPA